MPKCKFRMVYFYLTPVKMGKEERGKNGIKDRKRGEANGLRNMIVLKRKTKLTITKLREVKMKKFISLVIALAVMLTLPFTASAAENSYSSDMVQYFSITAEGTIYFDELSAEEDGVGSTSIMAVREQIGKMNRLILEENAYVTDDYSVVMYFASTRAAGEYKVVTHWYGMTEIYLNSDQAADLLDSMKTISTGSEFWDTVLSVVPGLGTSISLTNLQTMIYRADLERAEASKTGIIIYVYTDPSTTAQSVTFAAQ